MYITAKPILEKNCSDSVTLARVPIPSACSRNTGLNFDELVARDLFQECVYVSPSGVAFSI